MKLFNKKPVVILFVILLTLNLYSKENINLFKLNNNIYEDKSVDSKIVKVKKKKYVEQKDILDIDLNKSSSYPWFKTIEGWVTYPFVKINDKSKYNSLIEKELKENKLQKRSSLSKKSKKIVTEKNDINKGKYFIKHIEIENLPNDLKDELLRIVNLFTKKYYSINELNKIKEVIENYLKAKNRLFIKVLIPKQDLSDEILKVLLVQGKYGNITVEGNKYYSSDFIKNSFDKKSGDNLNYNKLVESILLLNEYSNLEVKSYMKKGSAPASSDVVLKVNDKLPFSANLSYDNLGSKAISRNRIRADLTYGNGIVDGDLSSLNIMRSINPSGMELENFDYSLPINKKHTKLHLGALSSNYIVSGSDFANLGIEGETKIYTLGFSHPLKRTISESMNLRFDYQYKKSKSYLFNALSSLDRLKVISAGFNTQENGVFSTLYTNINISKGSLSEATSTQSRTNQDNSYIKLNSTLMYQKKINLFGEFSFRLNTQFSKDRLPLSEVYSLGGLNSVRGYASSKFVGDTGFDTSLEYFILPQTDIDYVDERLKLGLFLDYGRIYINKPVVGDDRYSYLLGTGFEVIAEVFKDIFLKTTIGFPLNSSDSGTKDKPNLYVVLNSKVW